MDFSKWLNDQIEMAEQYRSLSVMNHNSAMAMASAEFMHKLGIAKEIYATFQAYEDANTVVLKNVGGVAMSIDSKVKEGNE